MNDWVGLINSVKENSFDKNKYDEMNRINNDNALIGAPQHMTVGNNNNNTHSFMNSPMTMANNNNITAGQK